MFASRMPWVCWTTLVLCGVSSAMADDCPLLLTPYLRAGRADLARNKSFVQDPAFDDILPPSHAGFITVDQRLGNHLFFWFFQATEAPRAPLMVWLNGGPGFSSMMGALWEHGPVEIDTNCTVCYGVHYQPKLKRREHSWTKSFSMLYIDSPVGVGYSYSWRGRRGYRYHQRDQVSDLYTFIDQFFQIFPEYFSRELYLGGEGYAAKYVSALAHHIHKNHHAGVSQLPLTGIYLGGPFFDPPTQSPASKYYLYSFGAISHADLVNFTSTAKALFERIDRGEIRQGNMNHYKLAIPYVKGIRHYDNYVTGETVDAYSIYKLLNSEEMRRALHVGNDLPFRLYQPKILKHFVKSLEFFSSSKSQLAKLMNHYKVLLYNGDYDILSNSRMVDEALLSTPWAQQAAYNASYRSASMDKEEKLTWFFYTKTDRLCRVVVHGAGHQTAHDQPFVSLGMMEQFVSDGCVGKSLYKDR